MKVEPIVLRDPAARSEAVVVPAYGGACVAFRVGGWKVLAEAADDEALRAKPSRYGIPVLYPWPNRLAGGRFTFGGREYAVPVPPPGPHANHGLARNRAWRADPSEDPAYVRCTLALEEAPFRSSIALEYRLLGAELRIAATVTNTGPEPMPFGFGLHPYFALEPERRGWYTVHAPAAAYWELEGFLPTGRRLPVEGRLDLRAPRALGADAYDDVLTSLPDPFAATLTDPYSGRSVIVRSDPSFREHVVYAPLDRDVVCLEPYTCATDAFNLASRGVDGGMHVLDAGGSWTGAVRIEAREGTS